MLDRKEIYECFRDCINIANRYYKDLMRPDILIRLKDKTIIADTKYKIIKGLGDISQADLYQVFAYAAKFKANEVWLIYPLLNDVLQGKTLEYKPEIFENKIKLKLLFAPLP